MSVGIFIFEAIRNLFSKHVTNSTKGNSEKPVRFRGELQYNKNPCTGCGLCERNCPSNSITVEKNSEGEVTWVYDSGKCIYCGQCSDVCPPDAIELKNRPKDIPDDRESLQERFDSEL